MRYLARLSTLSQQHEYIIRIPEHDQSGLKTGNIPRMCHQYDVVVLVSEQSIYMQRSNGYKARQVPTKSPSSLLAFTSHSDSHLHSHQSPYPGPDCVLPSIQHARLRSLQSHQEQEGQEEGVRSAAAAGSSARSSSATARQQQYAAPNGAPPAQNGNQ